MFDRKKVKTGWGGDVYLLGHEDSKQKALNERKEERDNCLKSLNDAIALVETARKETNVIHNMSNELKDKANVALAGLILLICSTDLTLKRMKIKKEMSLKELKEKAGDGD